MSSYLPPAVLGALQRLSGTEQAALISYIALLQMNDVEASKKRRRAWILQWIEFLGSSSSDREYNKHFWRNALTEDERNDAEVVYAMLKNASNHDVFGANPWKLREDALYDWGCALPSGFVNDPAAYLIYVRGPCHQLPFWDHKVPEQFRDNLAVMKEVCSQLPNSFRHASPRLKDYEDLVRLAAFNRNGHREVVVRETTERLRSDATFVTDLFNHICAHHDEFAESPHLWYWLKDVFPGPFSLKEMKAMLDRIPSPCLAEAIENFPANVRDDVELMLSSMQRGHPSFSARMFDCCSKRVQKDERIIQIVKTNAWESYFDDFAKCDAVKKAKVRGLKDIAANKVNNLNGIPAERRLDDDVVKAAFDHGILHDEESVLAFIKDLAAEGYEFEDDAGAFYSSLPDHLQESEAIALVCIHQMDCSHNAAITMLERIPRLTQMREVIRAVVRLERTECADESDPYLSECPVQFLDDEDIMMEAVQGNELNLSLVSERLLSDRDFMLAMVSYDPESIKATTPEFQLSNLDIVAKAIDAFPTWNGSWHFDQVSPEVWTNRPLIMKWLTRKSEGDDISVLKLLDEIHPESPLLNDKEVVSLSVQHNAADFEHASIELRCDRQFVLQLAAEKDGIVPYSAGELRFDEEIVTTAFARNPANLVDCFDIFDPQTGRRDLAYLLELSLKIRLKLQCHDIFVREFLRGMIANDQRNIHPSRRCLLPRLDRGLETSMKFKRHIAEYVGAPVGEEYVRLKGASLTLKRFGL